MFATSVAAEHTTGLRSIKTVYVALGYNLQEEGRPKLMQELQKFAVSCINITVPSPQVPVDITPVFPVARDIILD